MNRSCEKYLDRIDELIYGNPDEAEKRKILQHIEGCNSCRAYYQSLKDDDSALSDYSEMFQLRLTNLEAKIVKEIKSAPEDNNKKEFTLRSFIMSGHFTRIAAVLVVAIGLIFALNLLNNNEGNFTSWDSVLARVEKTSVFSLKIDVTRPDGNFTTELMFSNDYGFRQNIMFRGKLQAYSFVDKKKKSLVTVVLPKRAYFEVVPTPELWQKMQEDADTRFIIKSFIGSDFNDLGFQDLNGRKVRVLEVNNPLMAAGSYENVTGKLYADALTELPVQIEIHGTAQNGFEEHVIMKDIQWDKQVDISQFDLKIPKGFVKGVEDLTLANDETNAIKGLRAHHQVTGEGFPKTLAFNSLQNKYRAMDDSKIDRNNILQQVMFVRATCSFYATLLNEKKEPHYYGPDVEFGDAGAVVMSWKEGEGKYKVIFGDLHTEVLTEDEIKALEPQR